MMRISEKGITLIKEFEGCSLTAYPDPGTGGDPWTIGYGWTHSVDGIGKKYQCRYGAITGCHTHTE